MPDPVEKPCFKEVVADDLKIRAADENNSAASPTLSGSDQNRENSKTEKSAGCLRSNSDLGQESKGSRSETPAASSDANFRENQYFGLTRHRLILAACCAVAGTILLMSTIDLKLLINRPASIDTSFNVSYPLPDPELASSLSFVEGERWGKNREFSEGLAPVTQATWDSDKVGFVDKSGKIVIKPQFSDVGDFHEGLAVARPYYDKEKFNSQYNNNNDAFDSNSSFGRDKTVREQPPPWGYIDKTGRFVIKPQFENAGEFKDGVASVLYRNADGKTGETQGGIIDPDGNQLIKTPTHASPNRLGSVFSVQQSMGKIGVIDKNGKWVVPPEYDSISGFDSGSRYMYPYETMFALSSSTMSDLRSNYFKIGKDGKCGVMDGFGKIVIPPIFADVVGFNNGFATVLEKGKMGFADASGKMVLPPKYDNATNYADIIAVEIDGKYSVIDKTGKEIPGLKIEAPIFAGNTLEWLSDGRAAVYMDGKVAYLNNKGEIVIPPKFVIGSVFQGGFAQVWDGEYWRVIDRNGNFASPLRFLRLQPFIGGAAIVDMPGPFSQITHPKEISEFDISLKNWKSNMGIAIPADRLRGRR